MATASQESIFNLIPKPQHKEKKKPIYRSKYDPKAPITGSTFGLHGTTVTVGNGINELKKTCVVNSTFGPCPNKSIANPSQFLRKGTRPGPETKRSSIIPPSKSSSHDNDNKPKYSKPSVPSSDDRPVMGLKTRKNYVISNAVEAIIQEPKCVDRKESLYIGKENYGRIPSYLPKVKEAMQKEQKIVDRCIEELKLKDTEVEYMEMDEEVRQKLIDSLKRKWDNKNNKYQKICHRVAFDSLGDIKRKEAQEAELQQLEDDIERLSKPGPVYIKSS